MCRAEPLTPGLLFFWQVDGNSSTLSMGVHFKQLKRLVEEPTFSQILIPLQAVLIPTLPSTGGANTQHDAFPGHWAYLAGFEDSVRKPTQTNKLSLLLIRLNALSLAMTSRFNQGT